MKDLLKSRKGLGNIEPETNPRSPGASGVPEDEMHERTADRKRPQVDPSVQRPKSSGNNVTGKGVVDSGGDRLDTGEPATQSVP